MVVFYQKSVLCLFLPRMTLELRQSPLVRCSFELNSPGNRLQRFRCTVFAHSYIVHNAYFYVVNGPSFAKSCIFRSCVCSALRPSSRGYHSTFHSVDQHSSVRAGGPRQSADYILEMWANAQRDGRPAEYRWRPLFNAAKFG